MMLDRNLKVLVVSSEVVPFAKTGGLADVAGALPRALAARGHDVRVAMPFYSSIDAKKAKPKQVATVRLPVGEGGSHPLPVGHRQASQKKLGLPRPPVAAPRLRCVRYSASLPITCL